MSFVAPLYSSPQLALTQSTVHTTPYVQGKHEWQAISYTASGSAKLLFFFFK